MSTVSIEQAQGQFPELIEKIRSGDEILITQGEQVVAKLIGQKQAQHSRRPGTLQGTVSYMAPDFNVPLDTSREYMP